MHNNFFNRIFSKKWGQALCACVGPSGPPPFFGKNSMKKLLCIVCVCNKWHCRFFEAFDLPQYESVRVWAFLVCKRIEIRVMWTFTASKKENSCSFLRVRSSEKKKFAKLKPLFFSFQIIKKNPCFFSYLKFVKKIQLLFFSYQSLQMIKSLFF